MTRYIVLSKGEDTVFLRDRFHAVAFLLPFLWLGAHRLYLFAALAFLAQAGLWWLGRIDGFGFAAPALSILFGIAVALEGPRLVAWHLRRRGYREAGFVNADGLDEAELLHHGAAVAVPNEPKRGAETVVPPAPSRPAPPLFGWRSARSLLDTGPR